MTKRSIIFGVVAAPCIGGGWLGGPRAQPPRHRHATAPPRVPVVATKVQVGDVPIVVTGIGSVAAYNAVDIRTQVTNLTSDQAHLTNAQANLARYVPLLKDGFATQQQVADQASTVSQLQAATARDKAAIFNARTQLGYTTITSPINGVTGIRRVAIGNILQPSTSSPIVTITPAGPQAGAARNRLRHQCDPVCDVASLFPDPRLHLDGGDGEAGLRHRGGGPSSHARPHRPRRRAAAPPRHRGARRSAARSAVRHGRTRRER
jgi:multidrug efflux pump subunit AcrA (membrane-fusion protein)